MKTLLGAVRTSTKKVQHTKFVGLYVLCLKRIFFILPMLFLLCVISNCGDGARSSKPLKQLAGKWEGSSTVINKEENLFTVTSGSFSINQLTPDTIGFEQVYSAGVMQFGVPGIKTCKVSLKNNPSSGNYLLSFVLILLLYWKTSLSNICKVKALSGKAQWQFMVSSELYRPQSRHQGADLFGVFLLMRTVLRSSTNLI